MAYAKVYGQIFNSTVVEDPEGRDDVAGYQVAYVFQAMLVLSDKDGVLDRTPSSIARKINMPLPLVRAAIEVLERPDPQSRNPEEGGARIIRLDDHRDWGWVVVSKSRYRDMKDPDEERRKARVRKRRQRERETCVCEVGNASKEFPHLESCPASRFFRDTNVTEREIHASSLHTDTDTDTDKRREKNTAADDRPQQGTARKLSPHQQEVQAVEEHFAAFDVAPPAPSWIAKWKKQIGLERLLELLRRLGPSGLSKGHKYVAGAVNQEAKRGSEAPPDDEVTDFSAERAEQVKALEREAEGGGDGRLRPEGSPV